MLEFDSLRAVSRVVLRKTLMMDAPDSPVFEVAKCVIMFASAGVYLLAMSSPVLQAFLEFLSIGNCGLCGSE